MAGRDLDHISRQAYACNQGNGSRRVAKCVCVHTDSRVSVCLPPVVQPILHISAEIAVPVFTDRAGKGSVRHGAFGELAAVQLCCCAPPPISSAQQALCSRTPQPPVKLKVLQTPREI